MEYALIIDTDIPFTRRLRQSLAKIRQIKVIVVPTVDDAQLAIMRQPQDWIFIPAEEACKTAVSLQNLQPDARIIVITAQKSDGLPAVCTDKVKGIVCRQWSENDLRELMETAVNATPFYAPTPLDTAVLIAALQRVELDQVVQTAVIAHNNNYLAHWGRLNITQARYVVRLVSSEWLPAKSQTRLQFMSLSEGGDDLLLYTRRVSEHDYFILTALPEAPLYELRQRADGLTAVLHNLLHGKAVMSTDDIMYSAEGENSYAIVWRSIRPLPTTLHQPVKTAIERLATASACRLIYTDVQPEYVHLVVSCPSQKDSGWASTLFKNGSEETIQQQSNANTPLWDSGFYATDSKRPLTDLELRLFLTS